MQQHPVPQHISSYEFKLVGDMTLKQFFQLAGGIGIALLFYATPLPVFIKWPFILFFSLLGTALAFLPFEERPLSAWIFAFFKAVYSPTKYVWAKGQAEDVFPKETGPGSVGASGPTPQFITPQGEKRAEEYLSQVPQPETVPEFEQKETSFVQKVTEMFQVAPAGTGQTTPAQTQQQRVVLQVEEVKDKAEVAIPKIEPIKTELLDYKMETVTMPKPQPQPVAPAVQTGPVAPVLNRPTPPSPPAPVPSGMGTVFAPETALPPPPTQPNTISGQTLTREGKIVDGAILEIKDSNGMPVRALKSNKAGHFLTVTPLSNGEYVITTEKDGLSFPAVKFVTQDQIIPPILIRAK